MLFSSAFEIKHAVLKWPVAKIKLSEAEGVGIRVSLRTDLAVSLGQCLPTVDVVGHILAPVVPLFLILI